MRELTQMSASRGCCDTNTIHMQRAQLQSHTRQHGNPERGAQSHVLGICHDMVHRVARRPRTHRARRLRRSYCHQQ
jgi:hypothetical protein